MAEETVSGFEALRGLGTQGAGAPPVTVHMTSNWPSRSLRRNGWLMIMRSTGRAK
jgi:hypothetical protein